MDPEVGARMGGSFSLDKWSWIFVFLVIFLPLLALICYDISKSFHCPGR